MIKINKIDTSRECDILDVLWITNYLPPVKHKCTMIAKYSIIRHGTFTGDFTQYLCTFHAKPILENKDNLQ